METTKETCCPNCGKSKVIFNVCRGCGYCQLCKVYHPVHHVHEIEVEARQLIGGDRHKDYGNYKEEAEKIASLWSVITGLKIQTRHVPLMMIALKLNREANKPKRDNRVDLIGYTLLLEQLES